MKYLNQPRAFHEEEKKEIRIKERILTFLNKLNLNIDKKEWPYRSLFNTICIKKDADFYVYNL